MAELEGKKPLRSQPDAEAAKSDWTSIGRHVQDRPLLYIGAIAFIVIVLASTGIYRAIQASTLRATSTEYARALAVEDPAERMAALASVAESGSPFSARALYLEGEAALDRGDHEGAREAFAELRQRFPEFEFVPDAVEGLGFIEEDAGDYGSARTLYEEVASKWPDSAAAMRQPYNLARCFEGESNLESAIVQYRKQLETFPGSTISMRAQQRLNELREINPDLFADETPAAAPVLQELTTEPLPGQLELSNEGPTTTEPVENAPEESPAVPEQPATPETNP